MMEEEDDNSRLDLKSLAAAIDRVMCNIRDIEFSGREVPEKITVQIE